MDTFTSDLRVKLLLFINRYSLEIMCVDIVKICRDVTLIVAL